jgi:hypothetical protein
LLLEGRVSAKEKEKEENAVVLEETWTCRQRTKLEKERRAVEIDPSLKAKVRARDASEGSSPRATGNKRD